MSDFEILFYDGSKYQNTSKKEAYTDYQVQISHARSQLESCRAIEAAIEQIMGASANGNFEYFPCSLGRRSRREGEITPREPSRDRPSRPRSAPLRSKSPLTVHNPTSSTSTIANIETHSSAGLVLTPTHSISTNLTPNSLAFSASPSSTCHTPQSSLSNFKTPPHQRSKILKELDYQKLNIKSPILYACLKSNGNFEFQSEQFYFIDKPKKQEIRVRNGNTYFYEDNGELNGVVPDDIRHVITYWLNHENGRQRAVLD